MQIILNLCVIHLGSSILEVQVWDFADCNKEVIEQQMVCQNHAKYSLIERTTLISQNGLVNIIINS